MQEMGIRSRIRVKRRQSYLGVVGGRVADNLLQRNFKADQPNQKGVTDVTEYRVYNANLYLSTIKGLYNGEIVASPMSLRNSLSSIISIFCGFSLFLHFDRMFMLLEKFI
jgi:putative transposase